MTTAITVSNFNATFVEQLNANFTAIDAAIDAVDAYAVGVTSLAALKALPVGAQTGIVHSEYRTTAGDGGGGRWVWRSGNQSASVTADTQSGVWAAPDSSSGGADGAWQRQIDGPLRAEWFGVVVGTSASQATALQAAIDAAETLKAKLVLPAGYIRLDSTIYGGRTNPVWIEGQQSHRFVSFTGNDVDDATVLYFENLSSSAVAVDVGSSVTTESRDGVTIANLVVARITVSTAGAGDTGVMFRGVTNPAMTNVLVYGFDTNIHFNENGNGSRATAYGNFTNVASMWAGTYAGLATCMVDCRFDHCHFGGGTYGLRIQPPVVGSIWSNGNYFHSCTFVGSQGTVPTNNVLVEVGYWHTFHACDFEGAAAENMKVDVSVANGLSAGAYSVEVHDGWYSNAVASNTGNLYVVSGNILVNGGRFASVSTATEALIRFASGTVNGLTQFASTLANITCAYRAIAAVYAGNYRNLKVHNGHFYDASAGGGLPAFIIDTGVARSHFTNNSLVTTHAVGYTNASTTGGNRLLDNVLSATNNAVDFYEVQSVGGAALSVLSTTPRRQLHGTSQATAATLFGKYSADANGGFDYYFKSRRADPADARSAASSGDTIRLRRHVMDDGSTDVEVVREATSVDGTNGGAWEVYTKGDGGSLTRRIKVDQAGNTELGVASLAAGATDGFVYVPAISGAPTGTPTTKTGYLPIAVDTTMGRIAYYAGGWKATNRVYQSAVANTRNSVNGAGDATETALVTVTIPGNIMGANGRLRITTQWSTPGGAVTRTGRVRVGGISGTILGSTALSGANVYREQREWANRNATNSQVAHATGTSGGFGTGAATIVTSAIDTTANFNVVVSCFWSGATSGDSITLESYCIEVLYGA